MIYKLQPILKHRIWGGKSFSKIFNIDNKDTIGEAWILSCINDDNSPLGNHQTLKDVFLKNKNIVRKGWTKDFPILIKLIDAQQDLSIQVHPSIKTEFWHILNNQPSKLYMGLKQDVTKQNIQSALEQSTITNLLNHVDVKNGDSYLIKPGTIHAIGKKTFLIEIQQSADVTYRLYDYNRVDSDGKHRPLHIKESLDCINLKKLNILKNKSSGHIVSCPYFNVYRHDINGSKEFVADDKSFNAITVVEGDLTIKTPSQTIKVKQYETVFVPASEGKYLVEGKSTIILTTL